MNMRLFSIIEISVRSPDSFKHLKNTKAINEIFRCQQNAYFDTQWQAFDGRFETESFIPPILSEITIHWIILEKHLKFKFNNFIKPNNWYLTISNSETGPIDLIKIFVFTTVGIPAERKATEKSFYDLIFIGKYSASTLDSSRIKSKSEFYDFSIRLMFCLPKIQMTKKRNQQKKCLWK